jgi:hypothetical protein
MSAHDAPSPSSSHVILSYSPLDTEPQTPDPAASFLTPAELVYNRYHAGDVRHLPGDVRAASSAIRISCWILFLLPASSVQLSLRAARSLSAQGRDVNFRRLRLVGELLSCPLSVSPKLTSEPSRRMSSAPAGRAPSHPTTEEVPHKQLPLDPGDA